MEDLEKLDDAVLLACGREAGATFAVFYRRHVAAVLAFYAKRGVDSHRAGDLTAETFAAALLARRRYRPERAPARTWLLGIAANKLADSRRRWGREDRALKALMIQRVELTDRDVTDYEELGAADEGLGDPRALDELARLPEPQRTAIHERVFDERSYQEIADRHGVSAEVARQRVSRGLASLRSRADLQTNDGSTR